MDRPRERQALAVGLTLLSSLLYLAAFALSKQLVAGYGVPALQVMLLRCAFTLVPALLLAALPGTGITPLRLLSPPQPWAQRGAAGLLLLSSWLAVVGYALLPVTTASALTFTAPLMLTAMGATMLGERVTALRWVGTGAGFAGMLLIVRPHGWASVPGLLAALGSALTYAGYQAALRRLRGVGNPVDATLQVAALGSVGLVVPVLLTWHPMAAAALWLALLVTALLTAGLVSIAAALRFGEASSLAPWQYSGLLWAMAADAALFDSTPAGAALAGAVLVVGGGVLAQHARAA